MISLGHDVFGWLDCIRARPGMFLRDKTLHELDALVGGYYAALGVHAIVEDVPCMGSHFRTWLHHRTGWSCSAGWALAIDQRYPEAEKALAAFFEFVDEYRRLRPTRLWTVRVGPKHNPTGKQIRYGFDGLMQKPRRVDVMRYRPEPLHFLRFHYRDRVEDSHLLMTGAGEYKTSVAFAKRWVRDELQIEPDAWEPVTRRPD